MKVVKKFRKKISVLIALGVVLVIVSCSAERKVATSFVSNTHGSSILVIVPDFIYKANLKTYLMDSLGIKDDDKKDSLLLVHSKYLYTLDDSLFLANYTLGYYKGLQSYGFNVFLSDETEQFFQKDSNLYQINIAQLSLEETLYTFRDEETIYDRTYYHDHNLNAVYINSWFEIANLDLGGEKQHVYFTSDIITDIVDGKFDYDIFSNKIRYMYNIDTLKQDVLYPLAFRLGRQYAGYTFDLLLNKELDRNLKGKGRSTTYWHYNPLNSTFTPAESDKFDILEQ